MRTGVVGRREGGGVSNPKTVEEMLYTLMLEISEGTEPRTALGREFMCDLLQRLVHLEALTAPLHRYAGATDRPAPAGETRNQQGEP